MPAQLLDLSRELLRHIGSFLHDDYELSMPSFSPHWANFESEIDKDVVKHYLRFREVCSKIASACPLQGLHLTVNSCSCLLKWLLAPESVLRGVRRMEIDIQHPPGREAWELWITLQSFLRHYPNLQELVIVNTPMCRHFTSQITLDLLFPMAEPHLPSLESLSFQVECRLCSEQLPKLFIPGAPNLRHLNLCQVDEKGLIRPLFSESLSQDFPSHRIQTLNIKTHQDFKVFTDTMNDVGRCFPKLKGLVLSSYVGTYFSPLFVFRLVRDASTHTKIHMLSVSNLGTVELPEHTLDILTGLLAPLTSLEFIDLSLMVELDSSPLLQPITTQAKRSAYQRVLSKISLERNRYIEDITAVAQSLADRIPSLRGGLCWESVGDRCFLRRGWKVTLDPAGTRRVTVIGSAIRIASGTLITNNTDGTKGLMHV
ncbi:hypothetical protein IAU59_007280 [Kwoniella sp. CBS 9459]